MPYGVHGHEVVLDGEVECVPCPREPHLAHGLALDLAPNLSEQGRYLGEEVERVGEFHVEDLGRRGTVGAPPCVRGFGLTGGRVGELDPKGQCFARSLSSTSSAGTPVPGTCFRIDSARKP